MKQSAAKTLGVAALGAAFAAAGAGTASASSGGLSNAAAVAGDVTGALPVERATMNLPAGSGSSLVTGQKALAEGLTSTKAWYDAHPEVKEPNVAEGLLGGLPVTQGAQEATKAAGLPVGLPTMDNLPVKVLGS